ncbi:response regulator [Reichenbachiella sp. MALMAid0571]|uniref:response regulator n=1 Tax=Reichenbachiella sp. MALMAid0571 TaxID=3143939 RepID=UPI0032DF68AF
MEKNIMENTILYVDDEPANLRVFKSSFQWDYNIITAESANQALELLENNKVQVLVSDQRMPGLSGIELLEKVKERHSNIMRVLFTGYGDMELLKEAINNGNIHYYCSKPLNTEELNEIIKKCIAFYNLKEQNELLIDELKTVNEDLSINQKKLENINLELEERVNERTKQLKITNEALKESTEFSQLIINSYSAHIAVLDHTGKIIFVNQNWKKLKNLSGNSFPYCHESENYLNQPVLSQPNSRSELNMFKESLNLVLSGDHKDFEQFYPVKVKDSQIWYLIKVTRFGDKGSYNAILAVENVTRQKNAELKLIQAKKFAEEASKAKSTFVANISHDLRTPLNSVLGFSDLLAKSELNTTQQSYLKSIKSSGKALLELINDIIDISKIDSGKLELNFKELHVTSFIDEIINVFKGKIQEKGIELFVEIGTDVPEFIVFDEARLRQVLMNLIGNSLKFTQTGFVMIRVMADSSFYLNKNKLTKLVFEVEDSGIGISPDFQDKIFNDFSQENVASTDYNPGAGLGLFIVKKLVDLMLGEITFKSEVQKGTTFTITFDSVKSGSGKNIPILEKHEILEFENTTALIADDNIHNLNYLKEILKNTKIEIITALNGKELLDKATEFKPDIILTDLKMPIMDGRNATALLKRNPELKTIPVVAVTASAMSQSGDPDYYNIFDDLLIKPVLLNQFHAVLKKILPHKIRSIKKEEVTENSKDLEINVVPYLLDPLIEKMEALKESYQRLIHQQPINEVEIFAHKLQTIGNDLNVEMLKSCGNEIIDAVNNFEIDRMLILLKKFPVLLNKLYTIKIQNDTLNESGKSKV